MSPSREKQQSAGKKTEKQEAGLEALRGKISSLQGMTPMVRKRKEDREILTLWKQLRDLKAIEDSKQLVSAREGEVGVGEREEGYRVDGGVEVG